MAVSPYTTNSDNVDSKTTYSSYVSSVLQPITTNLRWAAFFICLLFYWVLLSVIFWILPISRMLRKLWMNKIFVFVTREFIFYFILYALYFYGFICVPERMFVQY